MQSVFTEMSHSQELSASAAFHAAMDQQLRTYESMAQGNMSPSGSGTLAGYTSEEVGTLHTFFPPARFPLLANDGWLHFDPEHLGHQHLPHLEINEDLAASTFAPQPWPMEPGTFILPTPTHQQIESSTFDFNSIGVYLASSPTVPRHSANIKLPDSPSPVPEYTASAPESLVADPSRDWRFPKVVPREHSPSINNLIFQRKRAGKTYKEIQIEIRERYGYELKEPTIRTRFRTVSLRPCDRLRKPAWTLEDVGLLKRVVAEYIGERASRAATKEEVDRFGSIWKDISDRMAEQRASYKFAPSTCKKKWMTVMGISYDVPTRPKHKKLRSSSLSSMPEMAIDSSEE